MAPEYGMDSTASDLSRLMQMMLNRGGLDGRVVLNPSSVDAMLKPYVPISEPGMAQGLGFFVCTDPDKVPNYAMTRGSFGHAGGALEFFYFVLSIKATIAALNFSASSTNSACPASYLSSFTDGSFAFTMSA